MDRNLIPTGSGKNEIENQIQQMQNADFLQQQIKDSLDEQGIKLQPSTQSIINHTVDTWTKQLPTAEELGKVQEINRNTGANVNPTNKVEAVIYISHHDEEERDKISFYIASLATERAETKKAEQTLTKTKSERLEEEIEFNEAFEGINLHH